MVIGGSIALYSHRNRKFDYCALFDRVLDYDMILQIKIGFAPNNFKATFECRAVETCRRRVSMTQLALVTQTLAQLRNHV